MKKIRYRIIPKAFFENSFSIKKPAKSVREAKVTKYEMSERGARKRVLEETESRVINLEDNTTDAVTLAVELSAVCRLPLSVISEKLLELYADKEISQNDAENIRNQVETQTQRYEKIKEEVEVALALVRKDGWNKEGQGKSSLYVTEIQYRADKEGLLSRYEVWNKTNKHKADQLDFGFHYSPYNFDSNPEQDFFNRMLETLEEKPADIEDIYFTGAMDDPH